MDDGNDTRGQDDDNDLVRINPASLADELSARWGTPRWSDLISIAATCADKAGLKSYDLPQLSIALLNVIYALKEREGKAEIFNTIIGPWVLPPSEIELIDKIYETSLFLLQELPNAPALFDRDAADALCDSISDFLVKSHLAVEVHDAVTSPDKGESIERNSDPDTTGQVYPAKRKKRGDSYLLYRILAHHWEDITGQPGRSAAWKNPVSREGDGELWRFMVGVCPLIGIKTPSISAVDGWKLELPKLERQTNRKVGSTQNSGHKAKKVGD